MCLNYGTNSAAEIFQNTLQQVLHGINGIRNIADDILIYGTTYEEHNKALKECLQRLELHGLTLNLDKCRFLKNHNFLACYSRMTAYVQTPRKSLHSITPPSQLQLGK